MTRAQKIWGFLFGVALIGGMPIVTLWGVFLAFLSTESRFVLLLGTVAFVAACFWRWGRRLLSKRFFIAELLVAILAGGLFMVVYAVVGYAAFRAD